MTGSLTKVKGFASQMWLREGLLDTLAEVGGLGNCSQLAGKGLEGRVVHDMMFDLTGI